ncbi:cytochrome c-type biogenesis protein CcmH [Curtobacterium pusillum]|uniref:cytochrome c-type biogenesis protein CcmH n=1 Tax=Curtobacterium pusillum TaxID=69373 RepID=UPI0011A85A95|nr:cytochrome c-type biogenesis protein CcmH [Curtobacterium pusillum]
MKKLIAAVVLAGAALLATPAAANAAGYTPDSNVSVSGTYAAGGTAAVNFSDGAFQDNETVNVQVTGAGAVTLGALPTTTVSKSYTASSTGSLAVRVTFPAGASGTYSLTATGATSGVVGLASFTVAPADTAVSTGANGTDGTLAFTGSTVSALALWVAGGAIVLGGGLLVVRGSVRRQRETV